MKECQCFGCRVSRRSKALIEEALAFGKVGSHESERSALEDAESYLRILAMITDIGVPMSETEQAESHGGRTH